MVFYYIFHEKLHNAEVNISEFIFRPSLRAAV